MSETLQASPIRDRLLAVCLMVFSFGLYLEAGNYPAGGDLFPKFSLVAIMILCGLLILQTFFRAAAPSQSGQGMDRRLFLKPAQVCGLFFVFVAIAPYLGFFASATIFIYAVMPLLAIRGRIHYLVVVPLIVASLYGFFGILLDMPFPDSLLI